MFWGTFWENRDTLENQYRDIAWEETTGLMPSKLQEGAYALLNADGPKPLRKAKAFAYILDNAQLSVQPADLFQDAIRHEFILQKHRDIWAKQIYNGVLKEYTSESARMYACGAGDAHSDFGHTVPDWNDILSLGFPGLLARLREYNDGSVFYAAGIIVYEAVLRYIRRLADLCRSKAAHVAQKDAARLRFCADDLDAIAEHAPGTLHQALQVAYLFHILQEEIEGERLRSLGGLDRLYNRFYAEDMASGRLTQAQAIELWQHFFQKFHALTGDKLFGEPMYLGGVLPDGTSAVNELSWLVIDAYDALNIANPKFHIRIANNTPRSFLRRILECIRKGNSSFVFISDECCIPMMQKVGATLEESREYVPIGCYEPGIMGREVACTGNGGVSLPKAVELAMNNGRDAMTGELIGLKTGEADEHKDFESLMNAVKAQVAHLCDRMTRIVTACEEYYMEINPSPLFSATMIECVQRGLDAYEGGAKYNNSSCYLYGNGTMADTLAMIHKHVFTEQTVSLGQLNDILLADWEGYELLRLRMKRDEDKWGNNRLLPDQICTEICSFAAERINTTPNARGGRFKAALFTIDYNYYYGQRLGASADGRKAGDPISRNVGASSAMDRNGVTALINSSCKLDFTMFPTGSVLDIILHPTAVAGDEGLDAFEQLVLTYFAQGGFAIHGNIVSPDELKAAQLHPDQYKHLQVRVCGWNVYFVNLSKAEQDEFIARAEAQ